MLRNSGLLPLWKCSACTALALMTQGAGTAHAGIRNLLLTGLDLDRCPRCGFKLRSTPLPRDQDPGPTPRAYAALLAGHT